MSAPPYRKSNDSLTSTIKDDSKRTKLSFSQQSEQRTTSQLGSGSRNDNNNSNNNKSNQNHPSHKQQQQHQHQQRAQQLNAGLRNKPAGSGGAPSDSTPKIDSDLVNLANENRVILNVGGIRHETYKVIELFDAYPQHPLAFAAAAVAVAAPLLSSSTSATAALASIQCNWPLLREAAN